MVKGKVVGKGVSKASNTLKRAGAGAKTVAVAESLDMVTDNAYVQAGIGAAEGAALGLAVGGAPGAIGGALVGGTIGFLMADGERVIPCDMIAIPAYQYSSMLAGREPTFQMLIKEGEVVKPILPTDFMESVAVVDMMDAVPKKRKLSKWQRYMKVEKNKIRFKSGKKKGQLNLKAMGVQYRKGGK
tara:strand:- start:1043 stop:1600 length:558 start_codon:yes stop_codon:yes gene_type:complete